MRGSVRERFGFAKTVVIAGMAGLLPGLIHAASSPAAAGTSHQASVSTAMNVPPSFAVSETTHRFSRPRLIYVAEDARFFVDDISGPSGKPIPVRIGLPPRNDELFRVVMFKGVPEAVRFSRGFALGEAWAVSPEELDGLSLIASEDFKGEFSLDVIYVHGKGDARQRLRISVSIGPAPAMEATAAVSAEVEDAMFAKSRNLLETGDVAGARLVFEFLARKGSARGAFALAQTYDPDFLESLNVRGGVRPDIEKAMKWYREAASMGSEPASIRLGLLRAGQ